MFIFISNKVFDSSGRVNLRTQCTESYENNLEETFNNMQNIP